MMVMLIITASLIRVPYVLSTTEKRGKCSPASSMVLSCILTWVNYSRWRNKSSWEGIQGFQASAYYLT